MTKSFDDSFLYNSDKSNTPKFDDSFIYNKSSKSTPSNNTVGSIANAVIGGLSTGGADIAQGIADTPTFIMQHLGIISPETANRLYSNAQKNTDLLRMNSGSWNGTPDQFSKAAQEHPIIANTGKIGVDLAGQAGMMRPLLLAGNAANAAVASGLGDTAGTIAGAGTRALGMGLLSQAGASPENKQFAFNLGAAVSPAIDLAGAAIGKLGERSNAIKDIQQEYEAANNAIPTGLNTNQRMGQATTNMWNKTDNLMQGYYNQFKQIPLKPKDSVNYNSIAGKIDDFLDTMSKDVSKAGITGSNNALQGSQGATLNYMKDQLMNVQDNSQALKILQDMKSKFPNFTGSKAAPQVNNFYNSIINDMKSAVQETADRGNLGNVLKNANTLYERQIMPMKDMGLDEIAQIYNNPQLGMNSQEAIQATDRLIQKGLTSPGKLSALISNSGPSGSQIIQQHIVKNIFDNLAQNPQEFNYGKASLQLGNYIKQFSGILDDNSINALKGTKSILDNASQALNNEPLLSNYLVRRSGIEGASAMLPGAAAGGYYGYHKEGVGGAVAGTVIGGIAGPVILQQLQNLLYSPTGQNLLSSLGRPGGKMREVMDFIRAMITSGMSQIGQPKSQNNTQIPSNSPLGVDVNGIRN